MINLKSVVEKYPECLDSATKFKSYMMDLYPDSSNKARIRILADIVDCGIALEIKNGKTDSISISNFCNTMENQYGYSVKLVEECVNQFLVAFGFSTNDTTNKGRMKKKNIPVYEIAQKEDDVNYICNLSDFIIESGTLIKYNGHDECVAVPNSVTCIGKQAFEDCESLTSIIIPDGVTSICEAAFRNCSNLKNIKIPNSVNSIGEEAIENTAYYQKSSNWKKGVLYIDNYLIKTNDTIAKDYYIKNGTKTIAAKAFEWRHLRSVTIPNSVTIIGDYAFSGAHIEEVEIPNSVIRIGEEAFYNTWLTYVHIPNSVTSIGKKAFCSTTLRVVSIPSSVVVIGYGAFSRCQNLEKVTIPSSVAIIGEEAFNMCRRLEHVDISNNVTCINKGTFDGCSLLWDITIPNSVTSIGEAAFRNCSILKNIKIPQSVTSIGKEAFYSCEGLRNVTIPNSVTSIDKTAFKYCNSFNVYFYSEKQRRKFWDCFEPTVERIVKTY